MLTDHLDYELPGELIAQDPIEPRDAARLLVDRGPGVAPSHQHITDLPGLVNNGDLLVVNNTRVIPSRVAITRPSGGKGEVLFLSARPDIDGGLWEALCRPSRKLHRGEVVTATSGDLSVEMVEPLADGRWIVRPLLGGSVVQSEALLRALDSSGVMPLPPYISHELSDRERYQTVYSRRPASAAAPTAGLHFTESVIQAVRDRGAQILAVELVVGLDTFRPITEDQVEAHKIHTEHYRVPDVTWRAVEQARADGRRVIAVGTTSVRALETVAKTGCLSGQSNLFITPGYRFGAVDLMLTNFHMPRTTLLAMIEAFIGQRWRELYSEAIERKYRFLSFGDAMLLERTEPA